MAKQKQGNSLYAFLDRKGVLATGNGELIRQAKQEYWAEYKSAWRRKQRKQHKAYTIYLTPKESQRLTKAANATSPTSFIKNAALAATGKETLLDPQVSGQVRELFGRCLTELEHLLEYSMLEQIGNDIIDRLEVLEDEVLKRLLQSKPTP